MREKAKCTFSRAELIKESHRGKGDEREWKRLICTIRLLVTAMSQARMHLPPALCEAADNCGATKPPLSFVLVEPFGEQHFRSRQQRKWFSREHWIVTALRLSACLSSIGMDKRSVVMRRDEQSNTDRDTKLMDRGRHESGKSGRIRFDTHPGSPSIREFHSHTLSDLTRPLLHFAILISYAAFACELRLSLWTATRQHLA